ncbi:tetratricopeptide repeat protein [Gilvimarinus sp. 1_MG-2023]|uniref:tetratricopeptide repeat protein n=1 Tax=Gilvimarinus sp. 1_MG-2023 TaxID=3062638 RepID=UPI0026E29765|nr:tetratricopeptide repeat protein [Gilvimarinus sp. 1_MG-2023]MDO6745838.1 tetratricopeptide repeat protein [Gilvimarinus sp. 1_MG-2023]
MSLNAFGEDELAKLNLHATTGAASGYVDDAGCGTCHVDKFESYQHVGMAQSFKRPAEAKPMERFGEIYYHAPSQRYYQIDKTSTGLVFNRWQQDADGTRFNQFSVDIDWILGSGNRSRSYLYQTDWGQLYQLPLGWYSETDTWGMAPGFESGHHLGVQRQVKRQCMFCHNAFPEVPAGSDHAARPHRFPQQLPQGTGCQRCHGPGASHIQTALNGGELSTIRAAITNPAKLPPLQRDSVCFQCHMLPSVSIIGMRRFGQPDYAFRPGQDLSEYLVHMDITEPNRPAEQRFEINHHGYRLWGSECYQKSAGALGCITCHDPHVKPDSVSFRKKVGEVCTDCHTQDQLTSIHGGQKTTDTCVSCHMPTRRTQDVIKVTMTDHRIARGPFDHKALVAPVLPHEPNIVDVQALPFGYPPQGAELSLYRVASVVRALAYPDALNAMKNELIHQQPETLTPYLVLLKGQLKNQQFEEAEKTAEFVRRQGHSDPLVLQQHAVALIGQGKIEPAIALLKQRLEQEETDSAHFTLGLALFRVNKPEQATKHLQRALELQPILAGAYKYLGLIARSNQQHELAVEYFTQALVIQPDSSDFYRELLVELKTLQQSQSYNRWLQRARRFSTNPESFISLNFMQKSGDD